MTAEVVVVIENQDARAVAKAVAEELGGGQARYAAADHHQIVEVISLGLGHGKYLAGSGQGMGDFKATCGAAPHPGECWRVILRAQRVAR